MSNKQTPPPPPPPPHPPNPTLTHPPTHPHPTPLTHTHTKVFSSSSHYHLNEAKYSPTPTTTPSSCHINRGRLHDCPAFELSFLCRAGFKGWADGTLTKHLVGLEKISRLTVLIKFGEIVCVCVCLMDWCPAQGVYLPLFHWLLGSE